MADIKAKVNQLLENDRSGHGMDHINRVVALSLKFAENTKANRDIVELIALLHDVDDYKLVGRQNATLLRNAKQIMNEAQFDPSIQFEVLQAIERLGYSKSLKGIRPLTLEGQIVSDADMCDAMGAHGILRAYDYSRSQGQPFFDRTIFPFNHLTVEQYTEQRKSTTVSHMFDKILKLKDLMMTPMGKNEAEQRHQIVYNFLMQFFIEENASEWVTLLKATNPSTK